MKHCKVFLVTLILIVMVTGTCTAERCRYDVYIVDASGGLNVRLGPDTEYKARLMLADGAEVVVMDIHNGWGLVNFRKLVGEREPMGWACMDYLVKRYDIIVEVNVDGDHY